jgi:uncharacterized membrane protein YidH (DUF202 family)
MNNQAQQDILGINQVQLLLSEKRTSLSVMRTGIAMLALPLSIFSALIATSKYYNIADVWLLLTLVSGINLLLIVFSIYLIIRSLLRMHNYDRIINQIKQQHSTLKQFL